MTAIRELASLSERARRWTGEKEKERERRLAAQAPTPAQQEAAREANEKERKAAEERRAGIELDWKNKLRDIHAAEVVKDLGGQEVHIGGLTLEQIKALVSESEREARDNYYGYNRPPKSAGDRCGQKPNYCGADKKEKMM
ncbi:hypothetical protein HYT17_00015 [Candidatus Microgenomates bacterium]|nr:hypothetical protein [Candidatus Microgenomates bacterium]